MKLSQRLLRSFDRLNTRFKPSKTDEIISRQPFTAAIEPGSPLAVIGDVHGCAGLLERILKQIPDDRPVLCVGDIIDRGDHSRQALDILFSHSNITVLTGNHEAMMLSFLQNPTERGRSWLQYGGLQTLASFGIGGISVHSRGAALNDAANSLRVAMGDPMLNWIKTWPTIQTAGNVLVTHAGADPNLPIEQQNPNNFIWGHPKFSTDQRADDIWVAHGHTIVSKATAEHGRISVDTGAYATGILTAALIEDGSVHFITA